MSTIEQMVASISCLRTLRSVSRLLPHGVVASALNVSKQRLSDLIRDGVVRTELAMGCRLVVVQSALTFAEGRYHRTWQRTKMQTR